MDHLEGRDGVMGGGCRPMNQITSGEEWFVRSPRPASTVQRRRDRGEGAIFVVDDGVNVTP